MNGIGEVYNSGGLKRLGVEYSTGPGLDTITMENFMDDKITQIWNTMAFIPGSSSEIVMIGESVSIISRCFAFW